MGRGHEGQARRPPRLNAAPSKYFETIIPQILSSRVWGSERYPTELCTAHSLPPSSNRSAGSSTAPTDYRAICRGHLEARVESRSCNRIMCNQILLRYKQRDYLFHELYSENHCFCQALLDVLRGTGQPKRRSYSSFGYKSSLPGSRCGCDCRPLSASSGLWKGGQLLLQHGCPIGLLRVGGCSWHDRV